MLLFCIVCMFTTEYTILLAISSFPFCPSFLCCLFNWFSLRFKVIAYLKLMVLNEKIFSQFGFLIFKYFQNYHLNEFELKLFYFMLRYSNYLFELSLKSFQFWAEFIYYLFIMIAGLTKLILQDLIDREIPICFKTNHYACIF